MKSKYIVVDIQNDIAAVRRHGSTLVDGFVLHANYLTIGEPVELADREVICEGDLDAFEKAHNDFYGQAPHCCD